MDFLSVLDKAQKNASKVHKDLSQVHSELDIQKRKELQRIELERRRKLEEAKKRKAALPPPPPEKKFQIPKKPRDEVSVDKSKIAAFLAKKEEEKRKVEKTKEIEKEKLAQLRIQANGGRVNKKLAKHFGSDPITLQSRFGNREHIEVLKKQQEREADERDRLADNYRGGVYKAIAHKKQIEEKARQSSEGKPKAPHRVATSKSNSLAGLSSRHAANRDHFSPPPEDKKKKTAPPPQEKPKKRPPPPAVDFQLLMKQAEAISSGKVPPPVLEPIPAPMLKKSRIDDRPTSSSHRSTNPSSRDDKDRFKAPSASSSSRIPSSRPPVSSKPSNSAKPSSASSSKDLKSSKPEKGKEKEVKKRADGRFTKGPTPPPLIPPPVPGKKYLPGDVRYQASVGAAAAPSISRPVQQSSSVSRNVSSSSGVRDKERERMRERERAMQQSRPGSSSMSSSSSSRDRDRMRDRERQDRDKQRERERARELEKRRREKEKQRAFERMSLVDRERMREMERLRQDYSDYEDEEEEYSEDDSFIDDGDLDVDDLSRRDFEETLSLINKNYDKKKWRERERMIDERSMEADFRSIAREEARSLKLGLLEDISEARKGKSEAI